MKTSLLTPLFLALTAAGAAGAAIAAQSSAPTPAATAAPAEPDAAVLAQMANAVRDGRFGAAYKRGLRSAPPGALRDRVLALDDDMVGGVFARIAARHLTVAEATEIAAFYATPEGRALTDAQLADPKQGPPTLEAGEKEKIAAFFTGPAGRKFNALLSHPAVMKELQLALAFIAGPDAGASKPN